MQITIKKGLDLPLTGSPEQRIEDGPDIARVAVLGGDYVGMKPTMLVAEGDRVSLGQPPLRRQEEPGRAVHRTGGRSRSRRSTAAPGGLLQSVVIRVDGDAAEAFTAHDDAAIDAGLDPLTVREQLIASGLWTALRTRPYSKVPAVDANPAALFVTAIDTNFGAPDPAVVIADDRPDFERGLKVLSALVNRKIWLCTRPGAQIPQPQLAQLERAEFAGPHPAGLPGTHIHFLEPVGMGRSVWYINYQDVMMVGRLFATGRIDPRRVIALSGPEVDRPRLLRTRLGGLHRRDHRRGHRHQRGVPGDFRPGAVGPPRRRLGPLRVALPQPDHRACAKAASASSWAGWRRASTSTRRTMCSCRRSSAPRSALR